MRWIAIKRRAVRLLQGDDAARPDKAYGLAKKPFRISGSACDKAHMHKVKCAGQQIRAVGIAKPKLDIAWRAPSGMLEKL